MARSKRPSLVTGFLTRREHRGLDGFGAPPGQVVLNLNQRDAAVYVQWARWSLGMEMGPNGMNAMRAADMLWRQEEAAIRRVAKELWKVAGPLVWQGANTRVLYRGFRFDDPNLDGKLLPASLAAKYGVPTESYTEDPKVACYFADPGKLGMPAISADGSGRTLPPYGYVGEHNANGRDVMFHFKYLLAMAPFFRIHDPYVDCPDALAQQEVTLATKPTNIVRLHDFHTFCGPAGCGYVEHRYGSAGWSPGPSDPFGPGWIG